MPTLLTDRSQHLRPTAVDIAVSGSPSLPKVYSNQRGHWLLPIRLSTKIDASELVDIIGIMQSYCMVLINGGILRVKYYLAITPR
jgi:hypothetical protein